MYSKDDYYGNKDNYCNSYDCLIVDDELAIAQSTSEYLNLFDVSAVYVTSVEDFWQFVCRKSVSLIILDINLGEDGSGFEVCKRVRETMDVPILFISARTSDDDILTALQVGGDDYIRKPFGLSVLLAKVRVMLRRFKVPEVDPYAGDKGEMVVGSFILHCPSKILYHGLMPIALQEMEYYLVYYLMVRHNSIVSKQEIFAKVWGSRAVSDTTLAVHIRHIRQKIEKDPKHPCVIKTIWGTGYMFNGNV